MVARRTRKPRSRHAKIDRVMCALADARCGKNRKTDPIVESLKQCPEAFKAGELLGKIFDSIKYQGEGELVEERFLPPPGTVLPPLV